MPVEIYAESTLSGTFVLRRRKLLLNSLVLIDSKGFTNDPEIFEHSHSSFSLFPSRRTHDRFLLHLHILPVGLQLDPCSDSEPMRLRIRGLVNAPAFPSQTVMDVRHWAIVLNPVFIPDRKQFLFPRETFLKKVYRIQWSWILTLVSIVTLKGQLWPDRRTMGIAIRQCRNDIKSLVITPIREQIRILQWYRVLYTCTQLFWYICSQVC